MNDLEQPLALTIAAAQEAGALLREEFHRPNGPRGSGDHADIDAVVERFLQHKLLSAFPWDYLGEELGAVEQGGQPYRWLVDPNDGTSSYLKGRRGSAVSIAALRDGVPVLGVVYAFAYPDDDGDLIAWAEGCPLTRNGQPVYLNLAEATLEEMDSPQLVLVSQDADKNTKANLECVLPARFRAMPSIAYRLALTAVGEGVAAVSLSAPCSWDYGAGHALLRAAGGVLVDAEGKDISYTAAGRSSTTRCFGGAPAVVAALHQRDWSRIHAAPEITTTSLFALARPQPGQTVRDTGRLARAQGCLLGQLAGDSLGGLVEFRSAASIQREYPNGVRDLVDGGHWHLLAGQPTDDSEMALMLARSLVQHRRYEAASVFAAYVHWFDSHPFDMGSTTVAALAYKRRSVTSQANGCLMRISPLGIFGAGRAAEAADWARQDSQLTHPHKVCQDACAVFVAAVATAIANGGGREVCYEAALHEAERSQVVADIRHVLEEARQAPPEVYDDHRQGWVLIALHNAFYQLLNAASLEEGVVHTVSQGGDTDTNAAIAGALLGAVYGRQGVPAPWLQAILSCRPLRGTPTAHPRPVEFWPVDALELAEALLLAGSNQ